MKETVKYNETIISTQDDSEDSYPSSTHTLNISKKIEKNMPIESKQIVNSKIKKTVLLLS
jgi:hypothetical protein